MKQKINKISSIIFISSTIILMIIAIYMGLSIIIWEATNYRPHIPFSITKYLLFSVVVMVISLFIYIITEIDDYKITESNDYNINEIDDYEDQPVYKEIKSKRYYIKKTKVNKNINRGRKYKNINKYL